MRELSALVALVLVSVFQINACAQPERPRRGPVTVELGPVTVELGRGPVTVELEGPLILGFFPPFPEAEWAADDGGIASALEHLQYALEDIAQCYKNESATYRLDFTNSITLRDGDRVHHISLPSHPDDWNLALGIVLAMPGRPPRTVFGPIGASTLTHLGPSAVAE